MESSVSLRLLASSKARIFELAASQIRGTTRTRSPQSAFALQAHSCEAKCVDGRGRRLRERREGQNHQVSLSTVGTRPVRARDERSSFDALVPNARLVDANAARGPARG